MDADETQERIHALETAQATQAATTAGMEATQTATTGGLQAAQAAAQAGTWAVMATGFVSLIVGIFLGMAITTATNDTARWSCWSAWSQLKDVSRHGGRLRVRRG